MIVELLVHSKAEMIAALQALDVEASPATTICLWRYSGLTWYRFPADYGRRYSYFKNPYGSAPVEVKVERDDPDTAAWRRRKVRLILAAVRRIPEREFVS